MNSSISDTESHNLTGSAVAKWEFVRDQIRQAIAEGEFGPGQRLPSERELATRFDISYMTARRAVTALVETGVIERRERSGTFVSQDAQYKTSAPPITLNVVCTSYSAPDVDSFLMHVNQTVDEIGWNMRILRVPENHQTEYAKAIIEGQANFVLLQEYYPWQEIRQAIKQATDKVVILGSRTDDQGICCVQSDNAYAMRLAVSHLQQAGHRNIGYVLHQVHEPDMQLRLAVWRSCFENLTSIEQTRRLIRFQIKPFENQSEQAYQAVLQYLNTEHEPLTGVVCQNQEVAIGTLAAFRKAGLKVPDDISVIALGNSATSKLSDPPLTCVDYNRKEEIKTGINMLRDMLAGCLPEWDRLRLTTPRVIQRESIRNIGPAIS